MTTTTDGVADAFRGERPTLARMRELAGAIVEMQSQLDGALARERQADEMLNTNRQSLETLTTLLDEARAKLDAFDPEAVALDACTTALEALERTRGRARRPEWRSSPWLDGVDGVAASAFDLPTGRVLLHLAQRFGVPIGPVPPEIIEPTP
jgi:hypothetical protein